MNNYKEINPKSSEKNFKTISDKDLGIDLPKKSISTQSFAVWIRALLQNWRQGTVSSKGRSDVARSNKKPFKQKGTGRARAGSARSPLWRGGGVTFGPQARVKKLSLPKKQKKQALRKLISQFFEKDKVLMLDWDIKFDYPKTAEVYKLLKEAQLLNNKVILFLSPMDSVIYSSFANIPNVRIIFFDQANAFDFAKGDYCIFLKKDFNNFKEMVSKWS